jgi:hypothetical protein
MAQGASRGAWPTGIRGTSKLNALASPRPPRGLRAKPAPGFVGSARVRVRACARACACACARVRVRVRVFCRRAWQVMGARGVHELARRGAHHRTDVRRARHVRPLAQRAARMASDLAGPSGTAAEIAVPRASRQARQAVARVAHAIAAPRAFQPGATVAHHAGHLDFRRRGFSSVSFFNPGDESSEANRGGTWEGPRAATGSRPRLPVAHAARPPPPKSAGHALTHVGSPECGGPVAEPRAGSALTTTTTTPLPTSAPHAPALPRQGDREGRRSAWSRAVRAFLLVNTNFFFTAVRVRATSRPKRKRRKTSARGLYVLFGRTVLVWTIRSRTAAVFFFQFWPRRPTIDRLDEEYSE